MRRPGERRRHQRCRKQAEVDEGPPGRYRCEQGSLEVSVGNEQVRATGRVFVHHYLWRASEQCGSAMGHVPLNIVRAGPETASEDHAGRSELLAVNFEDCRIDGVRQAVECVPLLSQGLCRTRPRRRWGLIVTGDARVAA